MVYANTRTNVFLYLYCFGDNYITIGSGNELTKFSSSKDFFAFIENQFESDYSYSGILSKFIKDIKALSKPIIIVYEDLDRIDDVNALKKIFYISVRSVENYLEEVERILTHNKNLISERRRLRKVIYIVILKVGHLPCLRLC